MSKMIMLISGLILSFSLLVLPLISAQSVSLGGIEVRHIDQSGYERNAQINLTTIPVVIEPAGWWDRFLQTIGLQPKDYINKTLLGVSYSSPAYNTKTNLSVSATDLATKPSPDYKELPTSIPVYDLKTAQTKPIPITNISRQLEKAPANRDIKFEEGDKYVYYYTFSDSDLPLKIGESSIYIYQNYTTIAILDNITKEPINLTHLTISSSAPYDNLVGYWNFDGDGTGPAYDFTRNNNDGTMFGPVSNSTSGIYGNGTYFDGSNDYITIPASTSLLTKSNASMFFWVYKINTGSTDKELLFKRTNAGGTNYQLFLSGGQPTNATNHCTYGTDNFAFYNGSLVYCASAVINAGRWYHLGIVSNDTNTDFYVDGAYNDTINIKLGGANVALYLGSADASGVGTGYDFGGYMDEIMIFNQTLNSSQITDIYNNQSARFVNQGTQTLVIPFDPLVYGNYNWMNLSFEADNIQRLLNTNISIRKWKFNGTQGYNDTDTNWNNGLTYWNHFDTGLNDTTGNYNSTTAGAPEIRGGIFNNSVYCDGSDDWVNTSYYFQDMPAPNSGEGNFSISFWFNTLETTAWKTIAGFATTSPTIYFSISNTYNLMAYFRDDFATTSEYMNTATGTNVSDGQWHNVVFVSGAGGIGTGSWYGLYYDGVRVDSDWVQTSVNDTFSFKSFNKTFGVCGTTSAGTKTSVDELMIYNRSINSSEALDLYVKGRANWAYTDYVNFTNGYGTSDLSLPLRFDFRMDSGTTKFYTPILKNSINLDFHATDASDTICSTGTLTGDCLINYTYTFTDSQIISGNGTLTIGSNGSISKYDVSSFTNYHGAAVHVNFSTITIHSGGNISGGYINITTTNLTLQAGAKIIATGLGYAGGIGAIGKGSCGGSYSGSGDGGGGCHGGLGGNGLASTGGKAVYDSSLIPNDYGSGAGGQSATHYGGSGGGIIRIETSDTLNLTGKLVTDGTASNNAGGGGAGGSIYILTKALVGSGNLSAQGGAGTNTGYSGTGGGGRIAVYYNTSTFTGISASSVTYGSGGLYKGTVGTMIFVDNDDNIVTIKDGFRFQGLTSVANETTNTSFWKTNNYIYWNFTNFTIWNNTIIITNNSNNLILNINDNLKTLNLYNSSIWNIINLSYIQISGIDYMSLYINSSLNAGNITLTLINLTIDGSSSLSTSSLGYPANGGASGANGAGAGTYSASGYGAGGAYGGDGGAGFSGAAAGGKAYGSSLYPSDFGSSGSGYGGANGNGGNGGGLLILNITNTFNLTGRLYADGSNGSNNDGGGSGGTIYANINKLIGSGNVSAIGGNGLNLAGSGGGGGGRIAIYYNTSSFTGMTASTVSGGIGQVNGSAGTLIFVDQVNNKGTIVSGFRFQGLTGRTNETLNTSFFSTLNPEIYNFTNLTIINANVTNNITGELQLTFNKYINFTNTNWNTLPTIILINSTAGELIYNKTINSTLFYGTVGIDILIRKNNISVKSNTNPSLNKSAQLKIYNGTDYGPNMIRDGTICSSTTNPRCDNLTTLTGAGLNVTFNVTSFTDYYIGDGTGPVIVFNYQLPADITSTNVVAEPLNITYNISDTSGLNINSISIFYKQNSTTRNCITFINGTCAPEWGEDAYTSNVTLTFLFSMQDNEIYPASYNLDDDVTDDNLHTTQTLTSQNEYIAIQLLNVTNSTPYNFFEIMSNSTGIQRLYYCNSTFTTNTNPSTASYCGAITSIPAGQAYNHTHTQYSKHQVIPIIINTTSGKTNAGIVVTPTSYFILRGNSIGNIYYYPVSFLSRTDAIRLTTNSGSSWSNQAFTVDSHLHQFSGNSSLYYYICANDTLNNQNCTATRSDLFDLGGLPPIAPSVYKPTAEAYGGNMSINYTSAISLNGYDIVYYNITLLNADASFNLTIVNNNSANLSYIWDSTAVPNANYTIGVTVYDNNSLSSTGYSAEFAVYNTAPTLTIYPPTLANGTYTNTTDVAYNSSSHSLLSQTLNNNFYDYTGALIQEDANVGTGTIWLQGIFSAIYGDGLYYTNFSTCDVAGRCVEELRYVTVDTTYPTINFTNPSTANGTYEGETTIIANITSNDTNFANVTIYLYNQTDLLNITTNTSDHDYYYEFTGLSFQIYYLNATVCDLANNCNSTETRTINLKADITPPVMSLTSPTNTSYLSSLVNLTGTCGDASSPLTYYSIDGGAYTGFTFNTNISTIGYEVWHDLLVKCNDSYGNEVIEARRFYVGNPYAYNFSDTFNETDPHFNQTGLTTCPNGTTMYGWDYNSHTVLCRTIISEETTSACKYKKLLYYNPKLAWLREENCV